MGFVSHIDPPLNHPGNYPGLTQANDTHWRNCSAEVLCHCVRCIVLRWHDYWYLCERVHYIWVERSLALGFKLRLSGMTSSSSVEFSLMWTALRGEWISLLWTLFSQTFRSHCKNSCIRLQPEWALFQQLGCLCASFSWMTEQEERRYEILQNCWSGFSQSAESTNTVSSNESKICPDSELWEHILFLVTQALLVLSVCVCPNGVPPPTRRTHAFESA